MATRSHMYTHKHQPLDVLLQDERVGLIKNCPQENVKYKVYPTSGNSRLTDEEDRKISRLRSFWALIECGNDFRIDALGCYTTILVNVVIIWASAATFVLAAWDLLYEGATIKWEGLLYGGPVSYERGLRGISFLTLSFGLSTVHMFIALMSTALSRWERCVGLRVMWAEGTLLDFSRQMGYFVGHSLITIGAAIGMSSVPQASKVLDRHPNMDVIEGDVTTIWEGHYNTRLDADLSVHLMLYGGCVCTATVLFQFFFGEGLNVCYIIPFGRCHYEWTILSKELKRKCPNSVNTSTNDAQRDTNDVRETVPSGLPFESLCVTTAKKNSCPWFATFTHNIFGAFRMHLYVATILTTVAIFLRFYSVIPPDDGMEDWPIYIPWSNTTHDPQPVYVKYTLHNVHNITYNTTITEWNDASYYMWTSGILFFTASILTVIGTFAYSIGLVTTRSSIPANHVIEPHNPLLKLCWS